MENYAIDHAYSSNPESGKVYMHERNSSSREGMQEVESTMEVLTRVDWDLAYSSEKLVYLHVLLVHLLAQDNNLEARMATENSYILAIAIEKALTFDLLSGILDSEVREVENFMDNIQSEIVDVHHKISYCRHSTELFTMMEKKLHNSEESLMKFQEHVLEVKAQSAKLPMAFSAFILDNWKDDKPTELPANGQISNTDANSKRQTAEKQRNVLRMLEKSLKREMDMQKKISALKQNEEHLKLKLHYTEQVSFRMEEAAEVVWGRFLEAENASEVLTGISKEMVSRLQIFQFILNGSIQREDELSSKLQDCMKQLDAKDTVIKKLESSIAEHIARSSQVPILMEKVKSLEEQLKKSELRLQNANDLNAESQEHLSEMENLVESLKESIYEAETRAETAESKVTQLTDTNVELMEEINFLKGIRDSSTKKVTVLEKQLRESEIQLQHAKASSEASQEQQNMLYSAIWDMETLIDDLKSKVSKAESKTDSVEEQCIVLSESNMELNKEISFLRSRVNALEMSLDEANDSKAASAKEIIIRTEAEAPVRIINRSLFTKSTSTKTNFLKPISIVHRSIPPQRQKLQTRIISTPKLSHSRIHSSFSPFSHSPVTPTPNPINFLLSLSSSHLSNPTKNSDFNFKSHQNEGPFTWNKAPESVVNGKVSVFSDKKPVVTVVLLGWLGAREKHLKKYVEWYNSRGIHAVTFVVDTRELFCFDLGQRVEKRITVLANELVSWVSENEDDGRERCLVFHTFSNTGWLVYGYILGVMQEREGLMEKIKGCVSDSGGGNQLNPKVWAGGFSTALMKKRSSSVQVDETQKINGLENQASESKVQEKDPSMIEAMVLYVFEMLFSVVLKLPEVDQKLMKIVSTLSEKQPSCPHLFLYSTADKLVPFQLIELEIQDQRRMGRKVISYNFESSPHVDHFRTFPDMYSSLLHNFLKECFPVAKQI